jgi:hypothetical protein
MRTKFTEAARLAWVPVVTLLLMAGVSRGSAADVKLEAQLIWGTNDAKSPDPSHKPVAADVARKLKTLPFKWANYYEVTCKKFAVPESGVRSETMSKECEIRVKNLGKNLVELSLVGRGAPVGKITQALPKGELLVTGGNAPNFTAWFVVLKQAE